MTVVNLCILFVRSQLTRAFQRASLRLPLQLPCLSPFTLVTNPHAFPKNGSTAWGVRSIPPLRPQSWERRQRTVSSTGLGLGSSTLGSAVSQADHSPHPYTISGAYYGRYYVQQPPPNGERLWRGDWEVTGVSRVDIADVETEDDFHPLVITVSTS